MKKNLIQGRFSLGTTAEILNNRYYPNNLHDYNDEIIIDNNHNDLGRFYKTPAGDFMSVGTLLGLGADTQWLQDWKDRIGEEEANRISHMMSSFGTRLHSLMEDMIKGDTKTDKEYTFPVIESFKSLESQFIKKIGMILLSERKIFSEKMRVAGTVDCVAYWDGKLSVIDFKTSMNDKKEDWIKGYYMQAFYYAMILHDLYGLEIEQIVIPLFSMHGRSKIFTVSVNKHAKRARNHYQNARVHFSEYFLQ